MISDTTAAGSLPGSALFVNDFVAIDRPVDETVTEFGRCTQPHLMSVIVLQAWHAESAEVRARTPTPLPAPPADVSVHVGAARFRADAIVLPVRWHPHGAGWLPGLDADLELAAFGPNRCHLHLLGRFDLPAGMHRLSTEASLVHRLTVALVRAVLSELALLMAAAPGATPVASAPDPGT